MLQLVDEIKNYIKQSLRIEIGAETAVRVFKPEPEKLFSSYISENFRNTAQAEFLEELIRAFGLTRTQNAEYIDRLATALKEGLDKLDPIVSDICCDFYQGVKFCFPEKLRGEFLPLSHVSQAPEGAEVVLMIYDKTSHPSNLYRQETLRRTLELHGVRTIIEYTSLAEVADRKQAKHDIFARDPIITDGRMFYPTHDHTMYNKGIFKDEESITIAEAREIQQGRIFARLLETGVLRSKKQLSHSELPVSYLDGGNVIFDDHNNRMFVGIPVDITNDSESLDADQIHDILKQTLGSAAKRELVSFPVDRTNDAAYHLDLFLAVLPNGEVVFNPHNLRDDIKQKVSENLNALEPYPDIIEIAANERDLFPTNLLAIGKNKLVLTMNALQFEKALAQKGYEAITPASVGVTDWRFNDAGVRCATLGPFKVSVPENLHAATAKSLSTQGPDQSFPSK